MASFVHLRVKSAYSLLEGAVRPKELAKLAAGMDMPAVAVTREQGLAALIATHNFELAARMDRALLLHQGKLVEGADLPRH